MSNNKIEVTFGDGMWMRVDKDEWEATIRAWDAENIEERIWRPLDTVIGYQEFVRIK